MQALIKEKKKKKKQVDEIKGGMVSEWKGK